MIKLTGENIWEMTHVIGLRNEVLHMAQNSGNESKHREVRLHQTKKASA